MSVKIPPLGSLHVFALLHVVYRQRCEVQIPCALQSTHFSLPTFLGILEGLRLQANIIYVLRHSIPLETTLENYQLLIFLSDTKYGAYCRI